MPNIEQFLDRHLRVVNKAGPEWQCFCVFHEDGSKASMYVNVDKQVFLCHGCGAKGSIKKLAKLYGTGVISRDMDVDRIRERLRAVQAYDNEETRVYPEGWLAQFTNPTDYWTEKRGLSEHVVKKFDLGYDPFVDAAIIPLRDSHGRVIGVVRRYMKEHARLRYQYPKGFKVSRYLFGSWLVRQGQDRKIALCEGSVDCIALWDAGVPALALLGSRLSDAQHRLLHDIGVSHVVAFTDNDRAGREAVQQIHDAMSGIRMSVVEYPSDGRAKDPADLSRSMRRQLFSAATPWHRIPSSHLA